MIVERDIVEAPAAPAAAGPHSHAVHCAGPLGARAAMDAIVALC